MLLSPREGDIAIASVRLSVRPFVCPLCYLLLNHWTKFILLPESCPGMGLVGTGGSQKL